MKNWLKQLFDEVFSDAGFTYESSSLGTTIQRYYMPFITGKGKVVDAKDAPTGSIPFRTAGVDVQRGHFWVVVRSWAKSGHSRLYAFGKVETWGGVEDMLRKAAVHKAMVFVDAGDQTSMVYAETARRGWKCARGSGNEDFAVTDRDGKTTRRFYSERQRIQVPGLHGQPAVLVSWLKRCWHRLAAGSIALSCWHHTLSKRHPLPPPPSCALAGAPHNFSLVFPLAGFLVF